MSGKVVLHLAMMVGIVGLAVLGTIYPFLPGDYDSLAMPLSTMTQGFGLLGLLLVPVGVLWLAYELRVQGIRKQNLPVKARRYLFALVSVIVSTLVALAIALVALATVGPSFGLLTLALWVYVVSRLIPRLKQLKHAESENFSPVPLYLVIIPAAVLVSQIALAAPLTETSRNHAIRMSNEMISDIEGYHAANGHYPVSLLATWKDYYPNVVGIERYHYAPNGDAYNVVFEQPRFVLDNLGTREFVVYNKLDEHFMISHTSWILILTPKELMEEAQGWYEVHDASSPHWRYFWFD